jgi:hypothetical protein
MNTIVGFTGSRHGMTEQQRHKVRKIMTKYDVKEAHHGDCVGADAEFHDLCVSLGIKIVVHPPSNSSLRAYKDTGSVTVLPTKSYQERNRDIVTSTEFLIACPETETRQPHSGTWYTISHAQLHYKKIFIFAKFPNQII